MIQTPGFDMHSRVVGESGEWRRFADVIGRSADDAVEMRPDHDASFSFARAFAWNQKLQTGI